MNRIAKVSTTLLLLFFVSISANGGHREEPAPTPAMAAEFLAGSYDVVGRYPESERTYAGTMTIALPTTETETLSVTRVINGITRQGIGALATTADAAVVLRVQFEEGGETLEATYLIGSDLDNYARLTGYVYAKSGGTILPGIEALFHDHYKSR